MKSQIWKIKTGGSALIATAIHAGGAIRDDLRDYLAIDADDRLREEDPYTDLWTDVATNSVVVEASRFQVDLNRPRDKAVYLTPEDAWGFEVWKSDLPEQSIAKSLAEYDRFYEEMARLFSEMQNTYGSFVVFDLHSYNHRRGGAEAPPDDPVANPEVNVGTGTMLSRMRFAPVIDSFIEHLRKVDFPTGTLDVRENVKFRGGQFARWTHSEFPQSACVLSIEFKKFFMDEWTGQMDTGLVSTIHDALLSCVPPVMNALKTIKK